MSTNNGLRINKLEIESFLKIRSRVIDAQGRHVIVHGPNGCGKTSLMKAIWGSIKGLSAKQFPDPIHHGETRARIRMDLGEFVIERKVTRSGSSLTVTRADGSKVSPRAQEFLNGLFRELSLDPVAFDRLKPHEHVDVVLSIAGVKPPIARVHEITGEEHPALAGESAYEYLMRLSQDERGLYYLRRREIGRERDQKDKAIREQREQLDRLGGPIPAGEKEKSAGELLKQVDSLQAKVDQRRAVADDAAKKRRECTAIEDKLKALEADKNRLGLEQSRIVNEIKRLQDRSADIQRDLDQLTDRLAKGAKVKQEWEEDAAASEAALETMTDPGPQISALRTQIQNVEADNSKTGARRLAMEQLDRLVQERERTAAEHEQTDKVLEGLRGLRAHLLDGVDLGVKDLEIGEEMLLYKGAPFPAQCSTAERYTVACALGAAAKPGLHVMFVDNAESLDDEHMAALIESADKAGMQLILSEVVRGEKGLSIDVIEEEPAEGAEAHALAPAEAGTLAYDERY